MYLDVSCLKFKKEEVNPSPLSCMFNIFQLMVGGPGGVSGQHAVQHVPRELNPDLVPVPILHLSMVVSTVREITRKLESALNAIVPSTVNGCHSPSGRTAARLVMEEHEEEQGTSNRLSTEVMSVGEMQLRSRSAMHSPALVS